MIWLGIAIGVVGTVAVFGVVTWLGWTYFDHEARF